MQMTARIPELVHRERFVKRVLSSATVSFVSGNDGWACVPFRQDTTRDVVLFWSNRAEAQRWADVVAASPAIHEVALSSLLSNVLPMLGQRRCLVGADWSSDPADPVIEPADLIERLWRERTDQFLTKIRDADCVWVLESASGPAFLPSQRGGGKEFLPVWATREEAEFHIAGSWAVKRPIAVSLPVFRDRYLPYLDQRGWFVGPDPMPGAGAREFAASEFAVRVYPAADTLAQLRAV